MDEEKLEQLKLKAQKARVVYQNAIDKHRDKVVLPQLKKMIGKCFKYDNSYGCSDNGRTWSLYTKVISVNEKNNDLICIEFQRTTLNIVEIKLKNRYTFEGENYFIRMTGWEEITKTEYNRAKKTLEKFIIEKLKN